MGSRRRRTERSPFVSNDARLHHHTPRRTEQPAAAKREPAASKRRAPIGCGTLTIRSLTRGVPGFVRRAEHLVDEALRLGRAGATDAPWPNTQFTVAYDHGWAPKSSKAPTVPKMSLIALLKTQGAARATTDRHGRTQATSVACCSTGEPLLSRRPAVVVSRSPVPQRAAATWQPTREAPTASERLR